MYCIVFGHNRRRSKIDAESGTTELINLGIKNGNVEVSDKQIKVKYVSEPTRVGRKTKVNTNNTHRVRAKPRDPVYKMSEWRVGKQERHYKSGKVVEVAPFTCYRHKKNSAEAEASLNPVTFVVKE